MTKKQYYLDYSDPIHLPDGTVIATRKVLRGKIDVGAMQHSPTNHLKDELLSTYKNNKVLISTRNTKQADFVSAVEHNTVIFCDGPAGVGKTYLAVSMALKALKEKEVSRIIITRPAVEAGESLGFLPGDLQEKLDPYLRPIFDSFREHISPEEMTSLIDRGIVEIAPLAYVRGRTFNDSFVILDEAQNTTPTQMKMFLTRLGRNSKMIINGDMSQIDIPGGWNRSGLVHIDQVLEYDIPGIAWVEFGHSEIVRHPVVKAIVSAYEKHEEALEQEEAAKTNGHGNIEHLDIYQVSSSYT